MTSPLLLLSLSHPASRNTVRYGERDKGAKRIIEKVSKKQVSKFKQ
jgi:hypothetical protein